MYNKYGYEKYVSFDLSMLNRFSYYTGIVFRGYTYGTGDAIVKGGRYNNLLEKFGNAAPSVGFAIYVDDLMSAISRNKINIEVGFSDILLLYNKDKHYEAIDIATNYRKDNVKVELVEFDCKRSLDEYCDYANKMHFKSIVVLTNEVEYYKYSGESFIKVDSI